MVKVNSDAEKLYQHFRATVAIGALVQFDNGSRGTKLH